MSSVPNYYRILDRGGHTEKKPYKNYDKIKINPIQRWSIFGSSGSGKNNALIYIIQNMDCWDQIYICARHPEQKLLQLLKAAGCFLTDKVEEMPDLDTQIPQDGKNRLFIFDDFQQSDKKTLDKITDYYTRCRHKKIAIMGLFQNYYSIPKICRGNSDILVITKILSFKDLKRMLSEYSINDISIDTIMKIYSEIKRQSQMDFMLIDLVNNEPGYRFRRNFSKIDLQ